MKTHIARFIFGLWILIASVTAGAAPAAQQSFEEIVDRIVASGDETDC